MFTIQPGDSTMRLLGRKVAGRHRTAQLALPWKAAYGKARIRIGDLDLG